MCHEIQEVSSGWNFEFMVRKDFKKKKENQRGHIKIFCEDIKHAQIRVITSYMYKLWTATKSVTPLY
jgi:hypothetical protein